MQKAVDCAWPIPTKQPPLAPGIVHIWCLALDLPVERVAVLATCLADDERARAARYHFDRHRRRFVACRGQVRQILSGYLGADPSQLEFRYGPKGKPGLASPWIASGIEYNVSHSHELAFCAVTTNRELGVDIEHIRTPHSFDEVAAQFFAAEEVAVLKGLSDELRRAAFFNCWTRKEAVLKAVGAGLSIPLNRVIVSLAPQEPAAVLKFEDDSGASTDWWIQNLVPAAGYVGAIASAGSPLAAECWQFEMAGA